MVLGKHINNALEEELRDIPTVAKFATVQKEGNRNVKRDIEYYNYFLNYYEILYKNNEQIIDNNTLTALTLLIAESNPKEKDVIIDLVMNFLNNEK